MIHTIELSKEDFKFSSAHFTIFSETEAEPLHGHNYQVSVTLTYKSLTDELEFADQFSELKQQIRGFCSHLDEKILLPEKSSYVTISAHKEHSDHLEVSFADRHYCFPKNEVELIPAGNITSEALSVYALNRLKGLSKRALSLSVAIKETSGQAASYKISF